MGPHNKVRLADCDDLLQKGVQLVKQVDGNTLGGWEVLHQGGTDGLQDLTEFGIVPPLLQSTESGTEDVEQSLTLATEIAGRQW